jgi:hypothetical protein
MHLTERSAPCKIEGVMLWCSVFRVWWGKLQQLLTVSPFRAISTFLGRSGSDEVASLLSCMASCNVVCHVFFEQQEHLFILLIIM